MSIDGPKKSRGRPPVESAAIKSRIAQPLLGSLDAWIARQPDPKPTRPEAIRRLLAKALGNDLEKQITEVKRRLAVPDVEKTKSPAQGMERLRRGLAENELRTLRQKRTFTKPPKKPKS